MASLYRMGQKFIDFCKSVTNIENKTDSVPASKVLYDVANDIATVETSTTASKAYTAGEYLVLNNQLYKVTANIASGGTITVGTNVSAVSMGSELKVQNDSLSAISYQSRVFSNASTLYINESEDSIPTTGKSYLMFNANQKVLALIRLERTASNNTITVINGSITFTLANDGYHYTVTPNTTLWGQTVILSVK